MHICPYSRALGICKNIGIRTYFGSITVESVGVFRHLRFVASGTDLPAFLLYLRTAFLRRIFGALFPKKLQGFHWTLLYHCYTLPIQNDCKVDFWEWLLLSTRHRATGMSWPRTISQQSARSSMSYTKWLYTWNLRIVASIDVLTASVLPWPSTISEKSACTTIFLLKTTMQFTFANSCFCSMSWFDTVSVAEIVAHDGGVYGVATVSRID